MAGGRDRTAQVDRDATLPLIVVAGWLYGLAEFVRQRWIAPSPPGIPGDGGGDPIAYIALGVAVFGLPALIALVAARGRAVAPWIAWILALAPTLTLFTASLAQIGRAPWALDDADEMRWLTTISTCTVLAALATTVIRYATRRIDVPRLVVLGAAGLALIAPVVLASRLGAPEPASRAAAPDDERPNVVLLTIDTLRADAVTHVMTAWPSGELDRQVVTDTWSNASWTRPAMASLFSGVVPTGHGADRDRAPSTDVAWFVEDMRDAGYRTLSVVSNPHLRRRFGFDRGFEVFEHFGALEWIEPVARSFWAEWIVGLHAGDNEHATADLLVPTAEELLDRHVDEGPWLLWVHLVDPHIPYHLRGPDGALRDDDPGPWVDPLRPVMDQNRFDDLWGVRDGEVVTTEDERLALRRLYQSEVDFALHWSARLLRRAGEVSGDRGLLWLMTSDHGEEFWDEGGFEHGHSMHRSVTRVPLWIGGTVVVDAARYPRRLIDVGPWLTTQIGVETMRPRSGSGLLDEDDDLTPFALGSNQARGELLAEGMLYGPPRTLIRWIDGAMVEREDIADTLRLRSASSDSAALRARAKELLIQLDLWRERNAMKGRPVEMSPDLVRQLEALGYVQ